MLENYLGHSSEGNLDPKLVWKKVSRKGHQMDLKLGHYSEIHLGKMMEN